jgi:hypothetical protein
MAGSDPAGSVSPFCLAFFGNSRRLPWRPWSQGSAATRCDTGEESLDTAARKGLCLVSVGRQGEGRFEMMQDVVLEVSESWGAVEVRVSIERHAIVWTAGVGQQRGRCSPLLPSKLLSQTQRSTYWGKGKRQTAVASWCQCVIPCTILTSVGGYAVVEVLSHSKPRPNHHIEERRRAMHSPFSAADTKCHFTKAPGQATSRRFGW